jgi:hypothetical protein
MMTPQPLGLPRLPDIEPLPRYALLGHLRPRDRYAVRVVERQERGAAVLTRHLISAAAYRGEEVAVHVAVCVRNPADRSIVLSVPGGRGAFDEATLCWLANHFRANYAAVDWIGRGRSPAHPHLRCDYDPIYMDDDDIRTSFMFHNLAAIWAVVDWLFGEGYAPVDVAGGSWGGVYSFLMAALEPRVLRIFPTFGCGGMSFPGVEKRSMWEAALEAMGPGRTRRWSAAFDPLPRIGQVAAAVHYDTATNDKFFSLEMAMATWSRVARPNFLSVIANQDHMTRPFGAQPYLVQRLSDAALAPCRALTRKGVDVDPRSGEIRCFPVAGDETDLRLVWSEQDGEHGHMSREWLEAAPRTIDGDAAVFAISPTGPRSTILFYLNRIATIDGHAVNASTPIRSLGPDEGHAAPAPRVATLLDAREADPVSAPFEDRSGPAVTAEEGGWKIQFAGHGALARASRFGVRPWLLPRGWQTIEIVLREPATAGIGALSLYLSRRYQRFDEEAVAQSFAEAESVGDGGLRRYRFARDRFAPAIVVEQRFRPYALPAAADIPDDFDAVGFIDFAGTAAVSFVLVSIGIS